MAPSQVIYDYFASAWPSKTQHETYLSNNGCPVLNFQPFLPAEVNRKLAAAESTASGYDRITYAHWWQLDLDCVLTTVILNACIHHHKIPKDWEHSTTVLIPKTGCDTLKPETFRPTSLCSTLYKFLMKCSRHGLRIILLSPSCKKDFHHLMDVWSTIML